MAIRTLRRALCGNQVNRFLYLLVGGRIGGIDRA